MLERESDLKRSYVKVYRGLFMRSTGNRYQIIMLVK